MMRNAGWFSIVAVAALVGCQQTKTESTSTGGTSTTATESSSAPAVATTGSADEVTMPNGLKYQDLVVGTGATAEGGSKVSVDYTGRLTDGTEFDSSVGKQPYAFTIGTGSVIRGWDEGIKGMKVGGKRKLTVPADMAYGARGYPPVIPSNATLVFDVELMEIRP